MRFFPKLTSTSPAVDRSTFTNPKTPDPYADSSNARIPPTSMGPLQDILLDLLNRAATGDFSGRIHDIDDTSPLAPLLHAFNTLFERMADFLQEIEENILNARQGYPPHPPQLPLVEQQGCFTRIRSGLDALLAHMTEREREEKAFRDTQADSFDKTFTQAQLALASAAEQLDGNASRLEEVLRTAAQYSEETVTHARETLEATQAIAAGSQELSASITEISRQTTESDRAVRAVKNDVRKASDATKALTEAAQSIDQVVVFIRDIADKTNLLALNATIEAARAGDAGKGFAVVASEVKALASQTSKATEDIAQQIKSMQEATTETVGAIKEIGKQADRVAEVVASIASAVEEQSAATGEISEHIQNTTTKLEDMMEKITEISRAASKNFQLAEEIGDAAEILSDQADNMKKTGVAFLSSLKGAQA